MEVQFDTQEFFKRIEEQFQETPIGTLSLESNFKETEEWSSVVALCIIAMVDEYYGKTITGDDLMACDTIADIYKLISKK